jgi:nuclear GTP-binding protein
VILSKVDPALLQKLYDIPPYADVREFLIRIALTKGRLGKGGVPDLEGSAVSVLRDWNSGKIPFYTQPPIHHPSTAPSTAPAPVVDTGDTEMGGAADARVGDAKILTTLTEAFTLEGLLDLAGDQAAWEGELAAETEGLDEECVQSAREWSLS